MFRLETRTPGQARTPDILQKLGAIDHKRPSETPEAKTPGKGGKTGKAGGATAAVSNVVQSGIRKDATKRTAVDALELIASLDRVFNELTPIEAAKALPALTELTTNVTAFVGTIKPARSRKIVKLPPQRAQSQSATGKSGLSVNKIV